MNERPDERHRGWHTRGYLPHFDGAGVIQSVSFRLADAVPESVLERWRADLAEASGDRAAAMLRNLVARYEDAGRGECHLKKAELAQVVEETLLKFDRERYELFAWVVMPNHVHALFRVFESTPLDTVIHSWKSYTATTINRMLNRRGRLWFPDYYDRFVRDEAHFNNEVSYIEGNPVKARLCTTPEDWVFSSARRRTAM